MPSPTTLRIRVLSDLHLEVESTPWRPPQVDADVVVLAGDTHRGTAGIEWAAAAFPDTPVLYLPGNHEFYGGEFHEVLHTLKATATRYPNLHVLDRTEIRIRGVRFLGCILWTNFELLGSRGLAMVAAMDQLNDFRTIRYSDRSGPARLLTPEDTEVLHRTDKAWLLDRLTVRPIPPTVVLTHHAPSLRCVAPRYWRDHLSGAFASALDDTVAASRARLWLSGHTHHVVDDEIGVTRLVSNPRGYAEYEPVPGFRPDLIVEVAVSAPAGIWRRREGHGGS